MFFLLAGSRFWQGGSFEVTKNTSNAGESSDGAVANKSTLEVVIPSELDGSAYVQVEVRSVPGKTKIRRASDKHINISRLFEDYSLIIVFLFIIKRYVVAPY